LLILGALACAMQLLDAGIGLFEHDPGKCAGPLFRCPPILRGVFASTIRADHPANQERIGSAPGVTPVAPACRREFRAPCKQFG
jgi:hypothetical protein